MMLNKKITERGNFNPLGQDGNQPDMRSPHERMCIGRPEARRSSGVLFALIGFCLAFVQPPSLVAQTAHFSGAIRTVGSGFSVPEGVAVDGGGNVFVADYGNSAVKEIEAVNGSIPASPTIRTLGSGFSYPNGVAVDAGGDVFVADTGNDAVKEIVAVDGSIPANPTVNTLATGFDQPQSVAVDKLGHVFVADTGNSAVKEIYWLKLGPLPGRYVVSNIGSGFSYPHGVAVDGDGNVFVSDYGHYEVEEITSASSYTTTNAVASVQDPLGLAVDGNGNVFVTVYNPGSDFPGYQVDEILAANGSIPANYTIIPLSRDFPDLYGVAVDGSGNVFVADAGDNAVKEILKVDSFLPVTVGVSNSLVISNSFTFDTGGTLAEFGVVTQGDYYLDFTDAGTGTCKAGTTYNAGDFCTVDVTFKPTAPGLRSGAVQLFGNSSSVIATGYVHGTGVGPRVNFLPGQQSTPISGLGKPFGIAADPLGNIYFADAAKNTVTKVSATNGVVRNDPASINLGSGFSAPRGVAVYGDGNVFVADYGSGEVKEVLVLNTFATPQPVGSGFSAPSAVAVDGSGNVFVADAGDGTVKEILISSNYATTITLASGFTQPAGVAVDANGNVYVTDYTAGSVNEILAVDGAVPANPTIVSLGSGFSGPSGVAVDVNGNVFVADSGNNEVKEIIAVDGVIPPSPTINTLGSGWNGPSGVVVDERGIVYVANANSGTISQLDYADPPSLHFASTLVGSTSSDSPQSVTLLNGGTAPLDALPPGLSVPPDFKLVPGSGTPSDCTGTFSLAPSESCNLSIEFVPVTTGNPLSESLVLTDNSFNAGPTGSPSQSILLSGISTPKPAALTSPVSGSTLPGPSVTFSWMSAANATGYALWIGSTPTNADNLYYSGEKASTVTSLTASGLPANGETIYVRLITYFSSGSAYINYTYAAPTAAVLASPTPGGTLSGPSVTFSWTSAANATGYALWAGTTGTGAGSDNLYYSGEKASTVTSLTASGLPTNGETIYVRLITYYGTAGTFTTYTYTSATGGILTTPAPSGTLPGPSATFGWTAGTGATGYALWIGSTQTDADNLYYSGEKASTVTSLTVNGLPTNGETIYVRLITYFGTASTFINYTYTAATAAVLTTPTPGSTLAGPSVTFSWTSAPNATGYALWIGSTQTDADNVYYSGEKASTLTSLTVNGLPTNGETIYVRLITYYGSNSALINYTYLAP